MSGPVLVLGATSAIARAVANELAANGNDIYLAGRDLPELWRIASDIEIRYQVESFVGVFDAEDPKSHAVFISNAVRRAGAFGGAVLAFGYLGDQDAVESEPQRAQAVIARNYSGAVSILLHLANHFEDTRVGFIVGISSVAGDRGRVTNYVYGSAKAGLTTFLQGLRCRLAKVGVPVLTVKPGFVDTAMTFGKEGMFLVADPETVAAEIVRAINGRKDVIYVPGLWKWIMLVVRSIPERVFKKLKF
ncbi:MAG: SDR family oxidoreductase [Armatimonadetes bacterium]|nr:SDR family oxidoreductase [Armatimonadota bacterium]